MEVRAQAKRTLMSFSGPTRVGKVTPSFQSPLHLSSFHWELGSVCVPNRILKPVAENQIHSARPKPLRGRINNVGRS